MGKSRNIEYLKKAGKRFKEVRIKKTITQEDVIFDTGINIGRVERGERDISLTTIIKLCDYYEISIHEFFSKIK